MGSSFSGGSLSIFISAEVAVFLPPKRARKGPLNLGQVRPFRIGNCVNQCAALSLRARLMMRYNSASDIGVSSRNKLAVAHHAAASALAISGLKSGSGISLGFTLGVLSALALASEVSRA